MNVDLSKVELPPFEIEITNDTLKRVAIAIVLTVTVCAIILRAVKKL